MLDFDLSEVVKLFGAGYGCGILLSVLPFVVGSIIGFAFKTMKGG